VKTLIGVCQKCAQTWSDDHYLAANANQAPIKNGRETINFRWAQSARFSVGSFRKPKENERRRRFF